MGLYDRTYWREGQGQGGGGWGRMTIGLPKPARAVKYMLLINLGAFVLQLILGIAVKFDLSSLFGATIGGFWQLWRYVTFQFLHSPHGIWHIALNMLGLYMFGSPLERHWGTKRFLQFYLSCGAAAGVAYVVIGAILGSPSWRPLIGASGGVYGILLACAVLFPNFRIILFLFPVPIRLGAIIIFGGMILFLLTSVREGVYSGGFWSHVAHLGGAAMAAAWIWLIPRLRGATRKTVQQVQQGAWQRKMDRRRHEDDEIDRILRKIHDQGLASLSRKEKKILQDATRRQRDDESRLTRL